MDGTLLPGLALRSSAPPDFTPLANLSLIVLVGVTGVGKSTVLKELIINHNEPKILKILPDRRLMTDVVIINPLGEKRRLKAMSRDERFALTARYREMYPGGMSHVLGTLSVSPELACTRFLLFDGLRGIDEVQHAVTNYPQWRFICLDAPAFVRVRRLLNRSDSFDNCTLTTLKSTTGIRSQLDALANIEAVFTVEQRDDIARLVDDGFTSNAILQAVNIIMTEHRYYDQVETRHYLATLSANRALLLDTSTACPQLIAKSIKNWFLDSLV